MIHSMKADPHAGSNQRTQATGAETAWLVQSSRQHEKRCVQSTSEECRQCNIQVRTVAIIKRDADIWPSANCVKYRIELLRRNPYSRFVRPDEALWITNPVKREVHNGCGSTHVSRCWHGSVHPIRPVLAIAQMPPARTAQSELDGGHACGRFAWPHHRTTVPCVSRTGLTARNETSACACTAARPLRADGWS